MPWKDGTYMSVALKLLASMKYGMPLFVMVSNLWIFPFDQITLSTGFCGFLYTHIYKNKFSIPLSVMYITEVARDCHEGFELLKLEHIYVMKGLIYIYIWHYYNTWQNFYVKSLQMVVAHCLYCYDNGCSPVFNIHIHWRFLLQFFYVYILLW